MYTSWFKNEPDENTNTTPQSSPQSSNVGTLWFILMSVTAFALVGIAVFAPNPGIYILICGLPAAGVIFTIWLLLLLYI
jgi:hypothetical protein